MEPTPEEKRGASRPISRAMLLAVTVVLALVASSATLAYAIVVNQRATVAATAFAEQIQVERQRSIRASCVETNRRHDETIQTLNQIFDDIPRGSERRRRAEAGHASTVLLIQAMLPKRNCEKIVREAAPSEPAR